MLLRHLLHQSGSRAVGNFLGGIVPLGILLSAEIRTSEDLLHADDLHTLLSRLVEKLEMLLGVGFTDFPERRIRWASMAGLDQTALYDTRHRETPYGFVGSCLSDRRRISSQ